MPGRGRTPAAPAALDDGARLSGTTGAVLDPIFSLRHRIHLPPGAVHRISAITDLTFAETSTAAPGWREDVVRLEDKYGRAGTSTP